MSRRGARPPGTRSSNSKPISVWRAALLGAEMRLTNGKPISNPPRRLERIVRAATGYLRDEDRR